ncbi:MAG: phytoene desaturase family protein [Candidatus Omnitrophica bacterium]|nr:phytoene desaturase family protein [Candidatus Omnitrophota bacterium]
MRKKIGVVGAGVGGLAVAARLGSAGFDVEVYEKLGRCGGRNNIVEDAGFKFDTGPSFVLMPDFFEEVFVSCGRRLSDYLDLAVLDPSYKIFYADGGCLTVHRDASRTKEELEKFEPGAAAGYDGFLAETSRIYRHVQPMLYKRFGPQALLDPRYWLLVNKIRALSSYWGLARKYFKSERLCYAFTFEAMFIGVSPFQSPAFYSVISYADHVQKIFHPMGGMYRIPLALEKLAREAGARIFYDSPVEKIEKHNGSVQLTVKDAAQVPHVHFFDQAVVNADYVYAQNSLLGRRPRRYEYSCSVYLLYLGLKRKAPSCFAHHNLFFAEDLRRNLKEIFTTGTISEDPSFYVHVPTVTDASLAPAGKEIFYVLVPVPNLQGGRQDLSAGQEARLRSTVFERINKATGFDTEKEIEVEHRFYPQDFITKYNIAEAATFGLAHTLGQSAFFRPANDDPRINGLYYVGASTQPGGGLPVVLASSRITADLIRDRAGRA